MRTVEVADALAAAVESTLRHQFGLSVGRFSLLMILHRYSESELTPSDLAQRAGVTRATVTGLLDGLADPKRFYYTLNDRVADYRAGCVPEHESPTACEEEQSDEEYGDCRGSWD